MSDGAIMPPSIERAEHSSDLAAKRTAPVTWNGTGGTLLPTPFIDGAYDDIVMSGHTAAGIPTTILFKKNGATVRTLTLTVSGNNVTEIARA